MAEIRPLERVLRKNVAWDKARINFLAKFLVAFGHLFGFAAIAYLCAEREFIGKVCVSYLRRKGVRCRIRVRANVRITDARGRMVAAR